MVVPIEATEEIQIPTKMVSSLTIVYKKEALQAGQRQGTYTVN